VTAPLYVEAPPLVITAERRAQFDAQWEELTSGGRWSPAGPKHEFLRWVVESQPVLLHGSNRRDVAVFEPRAQTDYADEPTHAVFATSDGIWPIYFAIADRRVVRSLINDCVHDEGGARYFFSVATDPDGIDPWTSGVVYLLPREPFTVSHGSSEWTSPTPVRPLASVTVKPDDFPFIEAVHRHALSESEAELHARLRAGSA
jgi:hypothetical protein